MEQIKLSFTSKIQVALDNNALKCFQVFYCLDPEQKACINSSIVVPLKGGMNLEKEFGTVNKRSRNDLIHESRFPCQ